MPSPWVVIGVPIDSVGRAGGTELAPRALREHDLPARVGAADRGDLDVRIRGEERDPESGVVGIGDVVAMTEAVRAEVRDVAADGARPLVLGGCCGLVPGALAGLRDASGTVRVAFVDGHVDVYDGHSSPTGEAADMPMSVAFGLGPPRWVRAAGGPSAAPADYIVLGARDPEEAADIAALRAGALSEIEVLGPAELRAEGLAAAGARAAERLGRDGGRFFVHLDLDVLDERAMPATDYLMPGGLEWDELAALLAPLGASAALAGLSLGCLNPEKDPGGALTERTCALLAGALTPSAGSGGPSGRG
jgi:arginase